MFQIYNLLNCVSNISKIEKIDGMFQFSFECSKLVNMINPKDKQSKIASFGTLTLKGI